EVFRRRELADRGLVAHVVPIGERDELPWLDVEHQRLIVDGPVADIVDAGLGEEVERVPGLLQARPKPAPGTRAGRLFDPFERAGDQRAFLVDRLGVAQPAGVALAMAHELPAELLALLDDGRRGVADLAVERDRRPDVVAGKHLHEAEDADTVAVFTLRPDEDVRDIGAALRHLLVKREGLDVGDDPERQPLPVRPGELRPPDDGTVGKRAGAAWLHDGAILFSERCGSRVPSGPPPAPAATP